MTNEAVAAIILAAGLSTRMGGNTKALCSLNGKTLLEHAVTLFQHCGITHVIVVTGHENVRVAAEAKRLGATSIVNARFRDGMFSSIQCGFRQLIEQHTSGDIPQACLLLPVDIPLVQADTVKTLLHTRQTLNQPTRILIPALGTQMGHPPLIPRCYFSAICTYPEDKNMRSFFASLLPPDAAKAALQGILPQDNSTSNQHICFVQVPDQGILNDLDTPADLAEAQHSARLSSAELYG